MSTTAISRRRKAHPSTKEAGIEDDRHELLTNPTSVDSDKPYVALESRAAPSTLSKKTGFSIGLSTTESHSIWTPSFTDALKLIALARILAALYSNIQDCDEVFNYWEPTHYLQYGNALQTWEYAPQYGIRSWAYVTLHAIVTTSIEYGLTINKIHVFYLTRFVLATLSALTDATLYQAVHHHLHPRIAKYTLAFLMISPGMFIAATSYLPSTFAMYTVTWAFSLYLAPPSRSNTWLFVALGAIGSLWGWPFSGVLFVSFIIEMLISKRRFIHLRWILEGGLIAVVTIVAPLLVLDRLFYRKWVVASLNIVIYNVFGGANRGPDIYGTEPWYFYLLNGLLNFNIVYIASLASLPLMVFAWKYSPGLLTHNNARTVPNTVQLVARLLQFYLWLAIFTLQSHKEERFMFVVFPIICVCAGMALFYSRGILETVLLHLNITRRSATYCSQCLTSLFMILFTVLSAQRIYAGYLHYHAPLEVYAALETAPLPSYSSFNASAWAASPMTLSNDSTPTGTTLPQPISDTLSDGAKVPIAQTLGRTVNVCVGKEWYRFPSHYFLQAGMRLRFLQSGFKGLLPKYFQADRNDTLVLDQMLAEHNYGAFVYAERRQKRFFSEFVEAVNDMNQEELDRYWDVDSCDYIIDTSPRLDVQGPPPVFDPQSIEPIYALDTDTWERVLCVPFLDSQHSALLTRVLGLPGHRVWLDYCLLVRR
ncbi:hypothetical protein BASA50_007834 [Batrachochytrium salamandrivorans]|uniref:Mannosyltransferase n=1 Tax=Batrachochytrium salamandrivorans TaxID=1357716 RepID=A0ABQ8F5T9_9FUNG|nr:hypothetical protein BASA50_007834 [Batrachochytrium salamandrivorans]KAH9272623.1 hypothetical protein BASA83_005128 [Batrachochytrium salamandrivorans]